jgi:hypothetical protein
VIGHVRCASATAQACHASVLHSAVLQALFHAALQSPCWAVNHAAMQSLITFSRRHGDSDAVAAMVPPALRQPPGPDGGTGLAQPDFVQALASHMRGEPDAAVRAELNAPAVLLSVVPVCAGAGSSWCSVCPKEDETSTLLPSHDALGTCRLLVLTISATPQWQRHTQNSCGKLQVSRQPAMRSQPVCRRA